jgi:plastocyanin
MRRIALMMAAGGLLLAGCSSGGTTADAPEQPAAEEEAAEPVTIEATEFAFNMPETLPAGEATYRFTNTGGQPHFFEVVRVEDDVTDAQIEEALGARGEPDWLLGSADGFGLLTPGAAATATSTYEPGTYVFLCFMPDAEGTEHAALGMWNRVTVTAAEESVTQVEPDVTVEVGTEGWNLPDLSEMSGEVTFALTGSGKSQRHSFEVGRLIDESMQPDEVGPALEGWIGGGYKEPAPVDLLGGFSGIPAGATRYFTVTLDPGTYLFHDEANPKGDQLVTIG